MLAVVERRHFARDTRAWTRPPLARAGSLGVGGRLRGFIFCFLSRYALQNWRESSALLSVFRFPCFPLLVFLDISHSGASRSTPAQGPAVSAEAALIKSHKEMG